MKKARERPLVLSSQVLAAPPPTASRKRLEQLLDDNNHKKKKKLKTKQNNTASQPPSTAAAVAPPPSTAAVMPNRFAHLTKHNNINSTTTTYNVFGSNNNSGGGGLASVPGFKAKAIITPTSTKAKTKTIKRSNSLESSDKKKRRHSGISSFGISSQEAHNVKRVDRSSSFSSSNIACLSKSNSQPANCLEIVVPVQPRERSTDPTHTTIMAPTMGNRLPAPSTRISADIENRRVEISATRLGDDDDNKSLSPRKRDMTSRFQPQHSKQPTKTKHPLYNSANHSNTTPVGTTTTTGPPCPPAKPIIQGNTQMPSSSLATTTTLCRVGLRVAACTKKQQAMKTKKQPASSLRRRSLLSDRPDQVDDEETLLPPPTIASVPTTGMESDSNEPRIIMHQAHLAISKDTQTMTMSTQHPKMNNDDHNALVKEIMASSSSSTMTRKAAATNTKMKQSNDNFVRQNLRNSAGACRGARNKKLRRRGRPGRNFGEHHDNHGDNINNNDSDRFKAGGEFQAGGGGSNKSTSSRSNNAATAPGLQYGSKMTGLDPLDEYLDGVFRPKKENKNKNPTAPQEEEAPKCARHQRPCKLIVVKKTSTGNKGRQFYACSLPRGEQCNHFQWVDDTVEAARRTLLNNTSHSSFIARQVAAHVERFRRLTVPELREETTKRGLNKQGKRQQLLMRLAIWARNEVAKASPAPPEEDDDAVKVAGDKNENGVGAVSSSTEIDLCESSSDDSSGCDDDDDDDSDSSDDEELVLFDDRDGTPAHTISKKPRGEDNVEASSDCRMEQETPTNDPSEFESVESVLETIFGHSRFREGQKWAIERCLENKRSVLVAPTGFGKSLCYALPAALMDGICLVVSPLISLIQDQLRSLPPRIPAATLSGSLSASATAAILDDVVRKRIKILFVSPERLTSASFRRLFNLKWNPETRQRERRFPDISLLCIDEAHCVSQWAHNFRPCFLRFKNLLKIMEPNSVLAMTATAGPRVIADIGETLGIVSSNGEMYSTTTENECIKVISKTRDNIDVICQFVPDHDERLAMLAKILKPRSAKDDSRKRSLSCPHAGSLSTGSIIVYVWRQKDTEVISEYLNSSGVSGGVVVYHGGMDANARSKAQSKFMRGKARICVATVAFGLGIDKADIVGIVHMYLSNSPEHFIQEIGRAGRDGRVAKAIAFPIADEVPLRHSLAHSNYISKSQIRTLLLNIRDSSKDAISKLSDSCPTSDRPLHIGLPLHDSILGTDCKAETIETLLSLIERNGGDDPLLYFEGFNYDRVTIALKRRTMEKLAAMEEMASCIVAIGQRCDPTGGDQNENDEQQGYSRKESLSRQFLAYSLGSYQFSVSQCANKLGPMAEPRHVFATLRRLQSSGELEMSLDTTDAGRIMHVRLSPKGVAFFSSDENFEESIEELTSSLHATFLSSIDSGAKKVLDMHNIMSDVAEAGKEASNGVVTLKSGVSPSLRCFQNLMQSYFQESQETTEEIKNNNSKQLLESLPTSFSTVRERELEIDSYSILQDLPILAKQPPETWNAATVDDPRCTDYATLAVTKFLHGLDSPRVPLLSFRTHPLFGKWKEVQFPLILRAVQKSVDKFLK